MPFQLSIPKAATALPHRKVTVDAVEDGTMTLNMKELLLSVGAEPKDVLPAVGFDKFQTLVELAKVWDIIEATHASLPNCFENSAEPTLKLIHFLLVKKLHPNELLCSGKFPLETIKNLLEMQLEWQDTKENYQTTSMLCDFCGCSDPRLRCSECMKMRKEVKYCNKECQTAGWKQHKKDGCGLFASDKAKRRVQKACGK